MATKKSTPAKRTFKRPTATKTKPEVKKKKAAPAKVAKNNDTEKVSLVLDETHVELHEEHAPKEDAKRQELAEELFQEPSSEDRPTESSKEDEKAASIEKPEVKEETQSVSKEKNSQAAEDDQEKVDQAVSAAAVVDQAANSEDVAEPINAESEQTVNSETDKEPHVSEAATVEEGNSIRWILVLIILFLIGLIGGLFYFFILQNKPVEKSKSTLKTVAVYSPTSTPTPATIAKGQVTIKVLNGSGVAGQAASVQSMLTSAGYNVVGADNADNSNYTKTEIQAKATVDKTFLTNLEQSLGTKYTVDTTVAPTSSSETDDVVVIIGSDTK